MKEPQQPEILQLQQHCTQSLFCCCCIKRCRLETWGQVCACQFARYSGCLLLLHWSESLLSSFTHWPFVLSVGLFFPQTVTHTVTSSINKAPGSEQTVLHTTRPHLSAQSVWMFLPREDRQTVCLSLPQHRSHILFIVHVRRLVNVTGSLKSLVP